MGISLACIERSISSLTVSPTVIRFGSVLEISAFRSSNPITYTWTGLHGSSLAGTHGCAVCSISQPFAPSIPMIRLPISAVLVGFLKLLIRILDGCIWKFWDLGDLPRCQRDADGIKWTSRTRLITSIRNPSHPLSSHHFMISS